MIRHFLINFSFMPEYPPTPPLIGAVQLPPSNEEASVAGQHPQKYCRTLFRTYLLNKLGTFLSEVKEVFNIVAYVAEAKTGQPVVIEFPPQDLSENYDQKNDLLDDIRKYQKFTLDIFYKVLLKE
jgi:hypothetical protein